MYMWQLFFGRNYGASVIELFSIIFVMDTCTYIGPDRYASILT